MKSRRRWDRSKVFADKAKNNCENICIIGCSFVSLQHSSRQIKGNEIYGRVG